MIFDQIANASLYLFPNALLTRGLEFLRTVDLAALPLGRKDLVGDKLFALVQEYSTRLEKDCFWEAHRKYIDIQFLASGVEEIGYAPISSLKITEPYDAAKDVEKFSGTGPPLIFRANSFGIFFPHDGHRPCFALGGQPVSVRKIVLKVAVE